MAGLYLASSPYELSVTDASRLSLLSPNYIIKLVKFGMVEGRKIGNFWVVNKPSLEAWLQARAKKKQQGH